MLFSSPFFRRLFLPYLLVICAAIAAVGFFAAKSMRDSYLQRSRQALSDQSREVAELIRDPLAQGDIPRVQSLVAKLHKEGDCRVTVIDAAGTVLADNEADPAHMENHANRPEVLEAGGTGEGGSVRPSATLHESLFYFARKLDLADGAAHPGTYFVRLAQHLASLDAQIHQLYAGLTFVALIAMSAAVLISFALARRDTRPVIEIAAFADAVAKGDLSRRYLQAETGEAAALAGALNGMADSLSRLLSTTEADNARLLAILGSMNEGVIATDTHQHVLFTNQSAGRLLGFVDGDGEVVGRLLWEIVRSDAILKLARDVLAPPPAAAHHVDADSHGNGDGHSDLAVAQPPIILGRKTIHVGPLLGRHLEVTASTFPAAGPPQGLILVAHDTTQSVQYQELRKEFVANVSHELRTPLSIIKGFAETLRDGAMRDPVRGVQYLNTIEKHADQLTNLVSDLLELSRLDGQVGLTRKAPVNVAALLRRVGESLQPVAQRKRHTLTLDVPADLPELYGNADYLDRAITNLLDNAIKYTPEGGRVTVAARLDDDDDPTAPAMVVIEVKDNGIGIPAAELPRIFERFYRVDRSRSRELGGTGLGLSIVKHVAQVHGGHVDVDSTPAQGSTFRLRLPLARAPAYATAE